jgi:hypothetical protein
MNFLHWNETRPGYYERHHDTREQMILRVVNTSKEAVGGYLTLAVKLDYDDEKLHPDTAIKEAWVMLQYEHPSLASVSNGEKMVYELMDDMKLQKWLEDTFIIDTSGCTKEQKYCQLKGTRKAILCFLPSTKELLFQATHELMDGVGAMMLMHNLCNHLVFPKPLPPIDSIKNRLSPSLAVAASVGSPSLESQIKGERLVADWMSKSSGPLLELGRIRSRVSNLDFRMQRLVFSAKESDTVKKGAKALGLSVAHAMHAASILAAKKHGNHETGNWVAGIPFNVRSRCQPPYNTSKYPITPYFMGFPSVVENPTDLIEVSSKIRKISERFAAEKDVLNLLEPFSKFMLPNKSNRRKDPPAMPVFGNLGLVSEYLREEYGSLKVLDVWLATHEISPAVHIICTTFRGTIRLNVSYNSGYHDYESIERYLQMVKDIVFEGLFISTRHFKG